MHTKKCAKYLYISKIRFIFASTNKQMLNLKTQCTMTKIVEFVTRANSSRFAALAQGREFKAEVVTFAESAPCNNPKARGWERIDVPTMKPSEMVEYLTKVEAKEIWYKNATLGGGHKVYVKQ